MAVPGDATCREVAPCGMGDWGDIPVDATTQFVNAAYPLNDCNGSQAKPWKTVQAGVNAAAAGAIVAVAAGTYAEDVSVQGKAVKVWGRCPGMVELKGTTNKPEAIRISGSAASATEVRGISITGPKVGVTVNGANKVVLARVRIHDMGNSGIAAINGPSTLAELELADSLVERAIAGVYANGATVTIERSVVREMKSDANGYFGRGIEAQPDDTLRANVTVRGSLVEKNHDMGILVAGSDALVEATVVRETLPNGSGNFGVGIFALDSTDTGERADVMVVGSLVEKNQTHGVAVVSSDARIDATVVRETQTSGNGQFGDGIFAQINIDIMTGQPATIEVHASLIEKNEFAGLLVLGASAQLDATVVRECGLGVLAQVSIETGQRANLIVRDSFFEKNRAFGVVVAGSDAMIEAAVVRETLPDENGNFGRGLQLQNVSNTEQRANVTVHASLIEKNSDFGVNVSGADVLFDGTVVRSTKLGGDGSRGPGIAVQDDPKTADRSNVTIRASLIENNHAVGISVVNSDVLLEAIVVRGTQQGDGLSPRGIEVVNNATSGEGANLTLRASVIENSHEIGIFVDGSNAQIEATVVRETQPLVNGDSGRGISVQDSDSGNRSNLILRASLIEKNHGMGIYVGGSDMLIEATVVRENLPDGSGRHGQGIAIESHGTGQRANVAVRGSLIDENKEMGIFVAGSDAQIEGTVVRNTQQNGNGIYGRGVQVQLNDDPRVRANVKVSASLIEDNHEAGIFVVHSDATIDSTLVRGTIPNEYKEFGDGIVAVSDPESVSKGALPSSVAITATRIDNNTRAGIANFGGAIQLVSSVLTCHDFDMDGEDEAGYSWSFDGSRDNLCGCPEPTGPCVAVSAGLEPPPILDTP